MNHILNFLASQSDYIKSVVVAIILAIILSYSKSHAMVMDYYESSAPNPKWSQEQKALDQYLRLLASLSVYALYCDMDNSRGLSTTVSEHRYSCSKWNERVESFYGHVPAVNLFEKYRNQASFYFGANTSNVICRRDQAVFYRLLQSCE